ncbi:MAG: NAD-dependent epimerase/dehydratase family protein [Pseudomonadota bacterium]
MLTAVTGASGHLGANLVRVLLARGRKVRVLIHRDTRGVRGLDVEQVRGDVLDPGSLWAVVEGAAVVYHCAGKVSVTGFERISSLEVNSTGPGNIAQVCLKAGVRRLIHISSVHALSDLPLDRPITEENGFCREDGRPLPYSLSKTAGERAILDSVRDGLDAVILNPSAIIGPHDYALSLVGETIRDLAVGRLPAVIPGVYDFVDVRDVVATALASEIQGRCGERYLIGGHRLTVRELAVLVEEITGTRAPRLTCPMWLARAVAPFPTLWSRITGRRPKFTGASLRVLRGNSRFDCSKAQKELGHAPRPMRQTLVDTIAWQRDAGMLR